MAITKDAFKGRPVPVGKTPKVFMVSSDDHGPADVARALAEGLTLKWPNVEKFFEVPEKVVREMPKASKEAYFLARELWIQASKAPGEGTYGELDVIPLLANNARTRFKMDHPKDAHLYYPTIELAKSAEAAGYRYVDKKDTKFKPLIPSSTPKDEDPTKHFIYNRETGKPEHVAMWIPKERYERHLRGIEAVSKRRMKGADTAQREATSEALAMAGAKGERYAGMKVISETRDENPIPLKDAYEGK
ncbi:MAG: hypothetical protein RBT73_05150 [Spirochaetia bacterium]|jgi:hypothetical protein|nr:hypothetical protein [Spirochaetia bacterium]